jgi:hypothetical protein
VAAVAVTAAVALAAAVFVWGVCRYRRVCRLLVRERAVFRVTDACRERDLEAFRARVDRAMVADRARRDVVAEAERVLDGALAAHGRADGSSGSFSEGGPV